MDSELWRRNTSLCMLRGFPILGFYRAGSLELIRTDVKQTSPSLPP